MFKNQKGITLVALVVTIVILIILAAISISVAVNSGLIDAAKEGKENYISAQDKWNKDEANIIKYVEQQTDTTT